MEQPLEKLRREMKETEQMLANRKGQPPRHQLASVNGPIGINIARALFEVVEAQALEIEELKKRVYGDDGPEIGDDERGR